MTRKIFRSILLVSAAVLLASLCIIMGCLYAVAYTHLRPTRRTPIAYAV